MTLFGTALLAGIAAKKSHLALGLGVTCAILSASIAIVSLHVRELNNHYGPPSFTQETDQAIIDDCKNHGQCTWIKGGPLRPPLSALDEFLLKQFVDQLDECITIDEHGHITERHPAITYPLPNGGVEMGPFSCKKAS